MQGKNHWYPVGTLATPFTPQEITEARMAFPANVSDLLPPVEAIPDEFGETGNRDNKWIALVNKWFHEGARGLNLYPHHGTDPSRAFKHLAAIMKSFEPKHEYKIAAVAFLFSLWYDGYDWNAPTFDEVNT